MLKFLKRFLEIEASSGIILFVAALLAMILANLPDGSFYQSFTHHFLFSINEGLMSFFFLLVGLELKRGFIEGRLSSASQVMLPLVAAVGGMLVPALIYIAFNYHTPFKLAGWATPVATDIAFALGVLTFFSKRVPVSLKLFLLALAIFDDLGAIVIIAFFYSQSIAYTFLFLAGFFTLLLLLLNQLHVRTLIPYLIIGVVIWVCLLKAHVHPTIAGVLLAFTIPDGEDGTTSPLHRLESMLHPWVAYFIMPIFALANAGFALHGLPVSILWDSVVLGIMCGLFFGKQMGVFFASFFLIKLRWVKLPTSASLIELYGVALLCGIGFTMSLFLGTLSFEQAGDLYLSEVRIGVLLGSLLSGLTGALVLWCTYKRKLG